MKRTFHIAGRDIEFVPEEPGVLLILLIVIVFLLVAPTGVGSVDPQGADDAPAASPSH